MKSKNFYENDDDKLKLKRELWSRVSNSASGRHWSYSKDMRMLFFAILFFLFVMLIIFFGRQQSSVDEIRNSLLELKRHNSSKLNDLNN